MMSKKYYCVIEVKVACRFERWQNLVNNKIGQAIEKLKAQWRNWEARFVSDTEASKVLSIDWSAMCGYQSASVGKIFCALTSTVEKCFRLGLVLGSSLKEILS